MNNPPTVWRGDEIVRKCRALLNGERTRESRTLGPEVVGKEIVEKVNKMMEMVGIMTAREVKKLVKEYRGRGREMVRRAEELKKESMEDIKTEREEEDLKRRMRELEKEIEVMEEVNRKMREEEWREEQVRIEEIILEKVRSLLRKEGNRRE